MRFPFKNDLLTSLEAIWLFYASHVFVRRSYFILLKDQHLLFRITGGTTVQTIANKRVDYTSTDIETHVLEFDSP